MGSMGCFQQPVPRSIITYSNNYIIEFIRLLCYMFNLFNKYIIELIRIYNNCLWVQWVVFNNRGRGLCLTDSNNI